MPGVFLVVSVQLPVLAIPMIVMVPIEAAIFPQYGLVPYLAGDTMKLDRVHIHSERIRGSHADYSILLTNNYMSLQKVPGSNREAGIQAPMLSLFLYFTSGTIIILVDISVFHRPQRAVGDPGHLIGRGRCSA